MKLAVSNIAWAPDQREAAYAILAHHGASGLEIAPGLLLCDAADPFAPSTQDVDSALDVLRRYDLQLVSMQSLLFGVRDAALFGTPLERETLYSGLVRAIALAGTLAIPNLVFGSPRQRVIPQAMEGQVAWQEAAELFRRLGDEAARQDTRIAIEPNGAAYGTNFLNRVEEALAFVAKVDHPAIVLNFDIGALHMEGDFERVEAIVAKSLPRIGHVHHSEPDLAPAPARSEQAARVLRALDEAGYSGWHSIEMRATTTPLEDLAASLSRLQAAVDKAHVA